MEKASLTFLGGGILVFKKTDKKKKSPEAENSARVRREAGMLFVLGALIPAIAGLFTALADSPRKK